MKPDFKVRSQSAIYIGHTAELLPGLLPEGRVVVITDENIASLYGSLVARYEHIAIGCGEQVKTLATAEEIWRRLVEMGADRHTFILGIGGGIVTDIAGFAAATYMRGVKFGFVSTTLLGQVDASVGGKNGVNLGGYKNMVGTFAQPEFVVCATDMLATLPDREFRAELAEVVKAAVIADGALFSALEQTTFEELRHNEPLLGDVIRAATGVKVAIVERDERESGERRKLNLGHTPAHAIEKCSREMNHGEAVAVGLAVMTRVAVSEGVLAAADGERIVALLRRLGFVLEPPVSLSALAAEIDKDKKSEGDTLHIVLPTAIGACEVRQYKVEEIREKLRIKN